MLVEGAKELPEEQILEMAERAITESKSGVGQLVKQTFAELLKTTTSNGSQASRAVDDTEYMTFEDFKCALSRVCLESRLSIRFPN